MRTKLFAGSVVGLLSVATMAWAADPTEPTCTRTLQSVEVASGLDGAVFVTSPPNDLDRIFIVELPGRIRIVKNGVLLEKPFLDITNRVVQGCERGLLSVAFHPDFADNGYFYVDYTNPDIVVARYHVSDDPDMADPASALTMLTVAHPRCNHNGGQLQFGPKDGYLYVGMGDGAMSAMSQDASSLLGKMLRLDVDNPPTYVPADNPFVGDRDPLDAVRDEIWAFGLRNPWRFSFDRHTGDLYIGDVGAGDWEEIDIQPAGSTGGENYGWPCYQGNDPFHSCRLPDAAGETTRPSWSFSHIFRCAVIGGYVYRGSAIPALYGRYFYSDLCGGFVKTFEYKDGRALNHQDFTGEVGIGRASLSFGEDAAGELYGCTGGFVYKLVPPTTDRNPFRGADAPDCNSNCVPDAVDLAEGGNDCNFNGIPDECDVATGHSADCDGNGFPDECGYLFDSDCNSNRTPDDCDVRDGTSLDCDGNGSPDECDEYDPLVDCNNNGIPDDCDLRDGHALDCNDNGRSDACDVQNGTSPDCNHNGIPDACDVRDGRSLDCDGNGRPDECDADCNLNGIPDFCDIRDGVSSDCNQNAKPDECESLRFADWNFDGSVDLRDLAGFQRCFTGPFGIPSPCCRVFDYHDYTELGHVDLHDLAAFPLYMTGP